MRARALGTAIWARRRALSIAGAALLALAAGAWAGSAWWAGQRHAAAVNEIVALLKLPPGAGFHAKADAVRAFVNEHSRHKIDAEFYAHWGSPHVMAEGVAAHARGARDARVHMECSTRSALMSLVLRRLGFETRRIDIYEPEALQSHTFLEVRNPETGQWETQDPDYDISWRRIATGERVSVADAAGDLAAIEPCGRERCGWDIVSRERIKASRLGAYLGFIVVRSRDTGERYTVHTGRADPGRSYEFRSKTGTFCEVLAKNCQDGMFAIGAPR